MSDLKHPEVLWAQRSSESDAGKNVIYLTVNLPDINEGTVEYSLTSTGLSFKAAAGSGTQKNNYAFSLEFFAEVDPESSKKRITTRSLFAEIRKKELKSEYWPRLTKEKLRTPFIKTDFGKWVDEDEQDGNPGPIDDDFGGVGGFPGMSDDMDFSKMMQQSGGDFGLGGGELDAASSSTGDTADSDSDNDGPPPLEDVETAK